MQCVERNLTGDGIGQSITASRNSVVEPVFESDHPPRYSWMQLAAQTAHAVALCSESGVKHKFAPCAACIDLSVRLAG